MRLAAGEVFAYVNRRLRFNLHAIIDTAGKSLHGWFDCPANRVVEQRLKAGLVAFGCDPKLSPTHSRCGCPGQSATAGCNDSFGCGNNHR